jgi:predicted transcriptional regulator
MAKADARCDIERNPPENAMADETLIVLTTDIVVAHVGNNDVASADVGTLIQLVFGALSDLGKAKPAIEEKREPAVSIRTSVKADAITCLECGKTMTMLKRHLNTDHGLTPAEYRIRWNLVPDYPMVPPAYAARRSELALKIGLGRKPAVARGRRKKAAVAQ